MQDPDLRPSRRGCAALIQCCRVHERSWNAPSSLFYGARLASPVRGTDVVVSTACVTILVTS